MSANDSRHLLPVSSVIFKSSPDLRSPLPTISTLVDLREAQDTSITALPMNISTTSKPKAGIWSRIVSKIKDIFTGKKGEEEGEEGDREMEIGSPMDFEHERTGGTEPLRTRVSEESEWEDV
jgi:hypothetical protein